MMIFTLILDNRVVERIRSHPVCVTKGVLA